jgi:FkbM family methyltransferase
MKFTAIRRFAIAEKAIGYFRSIRSYSQFGEDVFLASIYKRLKFEKNLDIKAGYIVDVGAHRPIRLSNSYLFYRLGWKSINIDPAPETKALFDKVRQRDTNLQIAVSDTVGEATLYVFGSQSVWNTLSDTSARIAEGRLGVRPTKVPVKTTTLRAICSKYVNPDEFEILMIDAEGFDILILQTNDWEAFRPRLVIVEVHGFDLEHLSEDATFVFMQSKGYKLFSFLHPSAIYLREDSILWD